MFRFDYKDLPYTKNAGEDEVSRVNWRCEMLLTQHADLLKDKVVLDLACSNGRFAYPCLSMGAKKVVGVEARREWIDQGKQFLEGTGFEEKMQFVQADVVEYLKSSSPGDFDIILCFGFLYHTVAQVDIFRQVGRIAPEAFIIDTSVAVNYFWYGWRNFLKKPPCLQLVRENAERARDTTDEDGVAFWPSPSFLEEMYSVIGYDWKRIDYHKNVKDWLGMTDYKRRIRASYIGHRIKPVTHERSSSAEPASVGT